ncbi:hypothetical protein GCM10009113_23480 [Marinobacter szutsaonensis]
MTNVSNAPACYRLAIRTGKKQGSARLRKRFRGQALGHVYRQIVERLPEHSGSALTVARFAGVLNNGDRCRVRHRPANVADADARVLPTLFTYRSRHRD